MRSPYAAPDTPIASAKRPRPNASGVKLDYGCQSPCSDAEKENEVVSSPVGRALKDSSRTASAGSSSPETADPGADQANGKWRGHIGALFSPVLRIFGNEEESDAERIEAERQRRLLEQQRLQREEQERLAAAQQVAEESDEEEEEFNPYLFIKQLPPYREALCGRPRIEPRLPPRRYTRHNKPLTLVLDLDETLVHCSIEATPNADLVFPVEFNGATYRVHVHKRPHLEHFLREVAKKFEVVVFTASQQVYADALLDLIDPKRECIKHRLFRDSCLFVEGNYLKDLNVLGRDLSKTVLVDNSPHAFGYQVDNGIPIESWFEDPTDEELVKLLGFLETLHDAEDVRSVVRNHFRTYQLVRSAQ